MFETCVKLAPFLPLAPMISFALLVLFGAKIFGRKLSAFIACAAVGAGLAVSAVIFFGITLFGKDLNAGAVYNPSIVLFTMGDFTMRVGMAVDNLCGIMLFVVTLVSFLVHIFSTSYMHEDERYSRFFAYLGIFTAAMLGLVLADNFLLLYMSWELVGLASYFLIGFWFEKPSASKAAVKAFLTTRVGDAGMFLGMSMLFSFTMLPQFGGSWKTVTYNFNGIYSFLLAHQGVSIGAGVLTLAMLFTFMGAVGKSAQFPLHIWLPDAMEGPTPVSALIHAATMVAAGVYLVARLFPMFALSKDAMLVVALLGGFTAFFAATIGLVMNDIKRVLAYSTVSQLGYMIMALGVGGYTAGVFHLMTHAFFKALLFLGSGSVIHSMHSALHHNPELDPQDMRNMGGLAKFMPTTYVSFWIGTLALAGICPFAGFWSKDEILGDCLKWAAAGDILHWLPYAFGACAAFITAFYMGRLMFLTFHGKYRGKGHPHESPLAITIPLIVLAVFSVGAGFLGTPWANRFHHLVHYTPPAAVLEMKSAGSEAGEGAAAGAAPALHEAAVSAGESAATEGEKAEGEKPEGPNWPVMIISTIIAVSGLLLSALFYFWNTFSHEAAKKKLLPIHTLLTNKYYVDEFVQLVFMKGGWVFISGLRLFDMYVVDGLVNLVGLLGKLWSVAEGWCDKWIVDGLVNLVGIIVKTVGNVARKFQTGYVQNYIFIIVLGVILILLFR